MKLWDRHRTVVALIYLALIPVLMVTMGVVGYNHDQDRLRQIRALALDGADAHRALCVFKADLEQRVAEGKAFLATHQGGFAGIPAAVIRNSLQNQERTVKSLLIHCS